MRPPPLPTQDTLKPHPWAPLTHAEFLALAPTLPGVLGPPRRGPKLRNVRRTLDAIFWIACSKAPWRALPDHLGRADTAHRTLRRWAKGGFLHQLVLLAFAPNAAPGLKTLRYRIARAVRRMARLLPLATLRLLKHRRLVAAWPANPLRLPERKLSETAKTLLDAQANGLRLVGRRLGRAARQDGASPDTALLQAGQDLARAGVRAARKLWRALRLGVLGNRSDWRLC